MFFVQCLTFSVLETIFLKNKKKPLETNFKVHVLTINHFTFLHRYKGTQSSACLKREMYIFCAYTVVLLNPIWSIYYKKVLQNHILIVAMDEIISRKTFG